MARWRRAHTVAVTAMAVLAVTVALPLVALRLPVVRRLVATNVNRALASAFVGHVVIDRIGGLGLTRADGIDAHAQDAEGHEVIRVEGARARVSTWALIRSLIGHSDEIVVNVPDLSVARVEATLEPDDSGTLRIARAFALRPVEAPSETPTLVRVTLSRVAVANLLVHVHPNAAPPLDIDARDAVASVVVARGKVSVDLATTPLVVRGLPGGVQARGNLEAHVANPALRVNALWNGAVDSIAQVALVNYEDGHVDGVLDVARATPQEMRDAWPACPLNAPTEAHVEAHGTIPSLQVSAHAMVGAATVDVAGPVVLAPNDGTSPAPPGRGQNLVEGTLHWEGTKLDAQAFLASAPPSDLTAGGDVSFTAKPTGSIEGRGTVALAAAGRLGSLHLPSATMTAQFARSAAGEPSAHAELTVAQPGAPTVVTASLALRGGSPVVAFEAETNLARLQEFAPLGAVATGSASASATGTVDLGASTVDARLSATLANVAARGTSVRSARIAAKATGPMDAPSIDVEVDAEALEDKTVHFSALRGQGQLTFDGGVTMHAVSLDAAGDGEPAHARAGLVRISGGGARIDDAVIEGLGAPVAGALRVSTSELFVRAKSDGLDLARVASFASVPVRRGTLSFDVDATVNAGSAQGRMTVDLEHAALPSLGESSARVQASLDGRRASGHATASIGDIATCDLESSSVQIGSGPLLSPAPWRKAWGAIQFDGHVDLARLAAHLPASSLPVSEVSGTLEVKGRALRDSADDATPGAEIAARTTGLALTGGRGWHVEGIDPSVDVNVDGTTGNTTIRALVGDSAGALASLDAHSSSVPYAILFSDEDPWDALRRMPFDAHLVLSSRRIESLPSALGLGGISGELTADARWQGALGAPTIDVTAKVARAHLDTVILTEPLDLAFAAHYDGAQVAATLRADERGKQVLDASAQMQARAPDVLAGLGGASVPWTASARLKLDRLRLQGIALLDDRQVRGRVSGEASLDGLHADARASLALAFEGLEVGGVACRSSNVKVTIDGTGLDGLARLDQEDGYVEGHTHLGVRWGSATAPHLDVSQAAEASLSAKGFRAAFLLPFLSKSLSELDGRIDGDARVRIDPGGTSVRPEGTIALSDGTFELTSFGGQFHGASAKVTLSPDGVVRLQDAVAHGLSGSVRAAASARFDGVRVAGVNASIEIPAKDPLPLVFDGVEIGKVDGSFRVAESQAGAGGGVGVSVDVPSAHVQLPAGQSSRDVQSLGGVPGVKVGVRGRTGSFVEAPLDGAREGPAERSTARSTPVQITVHLGDVQVSRGTDLDVRLEGQPTITLADSTRVAGQIRMLRGSLDVDGKPFAIDRGTVSFVGDDPTNPQIVLTASWTAPDLTQIHADFVGPLKTGKVRLRSEPAKPQSEILALILFGSTDTRPGSSSNATSQVAPVAARVGDAATQPLNRALGGLDRALDNLGVVKGISTKIDTSQATPRPEVEVQIARDISLQIAWVLGVPPPGTNPDSTLVTLDWHFLRKWSLETTVGDAGTSIVDVVWQHQY